VIKAVALLLATTLAFGISIYFMQQAVGPSSPWMALMLVFCFFGLARIAEPIVMLPVPAGIRAVRPWESQRGLYGSLAVPQFGSLLRDTPLRLFNASVYVSARTDIRRQIESAEAIHFWAAVLLLPYLLYCAWSGRWAILFWLVIFQIVGNLYPIMHLRLVRGRLERVERRAGRQVSAPHG